MSAGSFSEEKISRLLGLLYEAGASPQRWPEFLNGVREAFEAESAFFVLVDPEQRCDFSLTIGIDPARQRSYAEYFHRNDEIYERVIGARGPHSDWSGSVFSNFSEAEFQSLEIYNDWLKPQGFYEQCAIALGGLEGGLDGGMAFLRRRGADRLSPEAVSLMSILGPHLTRALNLHRTITHLRQENAELRDSVEMLDLAIVSLDGKGRVLRLTTAAGAILEADDGLALDRGCLRTSGSAEQARLAEMIGGAAASGRGRGAEFAIQRDGAVAPQVRRTLWTPHPGGAMLVSRQPPKRPLQVVVTPFCSSEILLDEHPAALVFISDPDAKPASRAAVLRALYGLTPTECRLIDYLVQGHEVASAADLMRITVETARFHLKTIFRKTGTGRQSHLIRLVLELPGSR
jgi:DNA-binding CsgD family transcriptional regulator